MSDEATRLREAATEAEARAAEANEAMLVTVASVEAQKQRLQAELLQLSSETGDLTIRLQTQTAEAASAAETAKQEAKKAAAARTAANRAESASKAATASLRTCEAKLAEARAHTVTRTLHATTPGLSHE